MLMVLSVGRSLLWDYIVFACRLFYAPINFSSKPLSQTIDMLLFLQCYLNLSGFVCRKLPHIISIRNVSNLLISVKSLWHA